MQPTRIRSLWRPVPVTAHHLISLMQECGALRERALLAASERVPADFRAQLALKPGMGLIRETAADGQVLLEAEIS